MREYSCIGYTSVSDEVVRNVLETHLPVLTREVERLLAGVEQDR